jgi:hypothetical protein
MVLCSNFTEACDIFSCYSPIYTQVFQVLSFHKLFQQNFCTHFLYHNAGHKHHATHLILLDLRTVMSTDYKTLLSAFFSSLTFLRRSAIKAACSTELIREFVGLLWLFLVYCSDISRYGILQPDRVYLHFLFQESVSCNEVAIFTSV